MIEKGNVAVVAQIFPAENNKLQVTKDYPLQPTNFRSNGIS